MNIEIRNRTTNQLELKVTINRNQRHSMTNMEHTSSEYLVGPVYLQLKVSAHECNDRIGTFAIAARYFNIIKNDNLIYTCNLKISSIVSYKEVLESELNFSEKHNWQYILQKQCNFSNTEFTVRAKFNLARFVTPFASLYEDTVMTDFDLKGEDGSVSVHSVMVAGVSPVLKNMLTGNWQETLKRSATVADVTKETLEHFKEYIYLDKLPDTETGLENILRLGLYYLIPELVQKCIGKILFKINYSNIVYFIIFAIQYKIENLLVAILKMVHNKAIDVNLIPSVVWENVSKATSSVPKV